MRLGSESFFAVEPGSGCTTSPHVPMHVLHLHLHQYFYLLVCCCPSLRHLRYSGWVTIREPLKNCGSLFIPLTQLFELDIRSVNRRRNETRPSLRTEPHQLYAPSHQSNPSNNQSTPTCYSDSFHCRCKAR